MKRRSFIEASSALGLSSLIQIPKYSHMDTDGFKLGYQLFSVNEDMNRDPIGTLEALKNMGYQDFEIFGFDDVQLTYYKIPAKEFKTRLDDMNLSVTSGHYAFTDYLMQSEDELKRFVAQCIQGAKILNSPYITWPWLDPKYRNIEHFKILAEKLNIIGEQVTDAGLGFAYHNHGFEFEDHNGENGYDLIVNGTDPDLVKLQMDMYWVAHAGTTTAKELVEQHPGRYVMWHIKDMDTITRDYTELGNGSINYLNYLPDPKDSGLQYYYIEQGGNFTHNALQSAHDSLIYLKKNLQKYL